MDDRIAAAFARLPEYLGAHVTLSASALVLGLALSLPLAVAASRIAALRWPALTLASVIQTIPSLALLALFYPLLLAISAASERLFGAGFSALGFLPSLLALTLYSMLPILRNTIAGIDGVDLAVKEAARGVGMTDRQQLLQVELPIAAPVIMAGVRTAAVWVIGAATLSTPVGQTSLGNYIFTGLQLENWVFVLFGCVAAAGLALIVDQALGLIERGLGGRDQRRILIGAAALIAVALAALAPSLMASTPRAVIGAKTFTEQFILAKLIEDRLAEAGVPAQRRTGLGSTVAFRALAAGELDAYVEYTGTIWTTQMGRSDNPGRDAVFAQMRDWLMEQHGVLALEPLGFENAYALAMRREAAQRLGVETIADLAAHAPSLTIGGDFEFFGRPEWVAIRDGYGLRFKAEKSYQSTFMYKAAADGEADVISAFSSDGRIARYDLVTLSDPAGATPPYDAVILVSPRRAKDAAFLAALTPLAGAISVDAMRAANELVDRESDKRSVRQAAAALDAAIQGEIARDTPY